MTILVHGYSRVVTRLLETASKNVSRVKSQ